MQTLQKYTIVTGKLKNCLKIKSKNDKGHRISNIYTDICTIGSVSACQHDEQHDLYERFGVSVGQMKEGIKRFGRNLPRMGQDNRIRLFSLPLRL
ncbi:hypothetical protein BN439_0115 [Erwinia amylovora Ea644]|uniref:hypothetical protein n=1 Tax=Erwinia amylovora TaxID=552 RepID=UPI0002CA0679|nr:hypothetical protein [Erwinia amylovora]CCP01223.1 hypothetical protein BN439_0115 [Erwinia amylovora Ea644]